VNDRSAQTLRAASVAALVIGALLMLGSWDGLYDALELPKANPALAAQIGGLAFLGLGYLLWTGAGRPELAGTAARTAAIPFGGAAIAIAAWVIFRDERDLGIETAGTVVLIVVAAILALLGLALARVALRSP
jgi:hypothetical protein